jgi:hypothetical protein
MKNTLQSRAGLAPRIRHIFATLLIGAMHRLLRCFTRPGLSCMKSTLQSRAGLAPRIRHGVNILRQRLTEHDLERGITPRNLEIWHG